ncbi:MAG: PKD domain-containing protein, partial [Flavobacteriales bacterium]|nr:PKD domain-containing protein [Flavobacteriales bacterium]
MGAVSYLWDFGDGSSGTGPSPTHTYINSTTSDQTFTVMLVGSNAFGCVDTAYADVLVFPNPTAQLQASPLIGCHPLTAQLTNLSTGANSFVWNYGDGQQSDTTAAVHGHTWFNFPGPGTVSYPVSLTAITDHGCTSTATAQVQVHPQVVAGFVPPVEGCAPHAVTFINTSTGASTYLWNFGDQQGNSAVSPQHTYFNQGLNDETFIARLIATSSFGCVDTMSASILVHPQPIAQFIPGVLYGCQPLNVPFQDLSIGAVGSQWSFGDGAML